MKTLLLAAVLLLATARPIGKRIVAIGLAGLLVLLMIISQPAQAQFGFIIGLFNSVNKVVNGILGFITDVMRPVLEAIRSTSEALRDIFDQLRTLWEEVVWPIAEIERIRALAQQLIVTFRVLLNNLYAMGVHSAQLPNPVHLEGIMRNRQISDLGVCPRKNRWAV